MLSEATILSRLEAGEFLGQAETEQIMQNLFHGQWSDEFIFQLLDAWSSRQPCYEEILGAARILKGQAVPLIHGVPSVMDTCGTGGDQKHTFNISTASAFVVAGAGIPVAKHGNRSVSSSSGSADVLSALGVNTEADPACVARCLQEIGIGFLFAPLYHPAMKKVAEVRRRLARKTIFNCLGPLLNPAGADTQLIGVYQADLVPMLARAAHELGVKKVAVVHGNDGMDEITLTSTSMICLNSASGCVMEVFDPRSVGYDYCTPSELEGGDAVTNAARLRKTLKGHSQPIDHCVHLNAALAIRTYGLTDNMTEALLMAQDAISSGRAYAKLEALIELSHAG